MSIKKKIVVMCIVGIIALGIIFGIVDFFRIKNNVYPIFCIKLEDQQRFTETWWGLGYKLERELPVKGNKLLSNSIDLKFGLWIYTSEIEVKEKEIKEDEEEVDLKYYFFTVKEMKKCTNWKKIYYIDNEDRNYYLYCLDDVIINFKDGSITLYESLESNKITIDEVLSYLTERNWLNDGGTVVYKDDGETKQSKNGFTVVKCNAMNPIGSKEFYNKDIYIGPLSMNYQKEFCKQKD